MKRVVFVTQTLGMGGAEVFNLGLVNWLQNHGCDIETFTNFSKFKSQLPNSHTIPLVIDIIGDWKGLVKGLLLMPVGFLYYGWLALTHVGRTFLVTGFIEKILLTPWAKLTGSKTVWIEFGPLQSVLEKFGGFPGMLYKLVSKFPSVVIVPSKHTQSANSDYGMGYVKVIPCAITPQKLQTKVRPNLVVCVSRLEMGKGQDVLLSAWPEVIKKEPTAKLRIVGEGSERAKLQMLINDLGLQSSVELTGWVENALVEIAAAEVAVFPSQWPLEGFGIAAIEAMSQSKPVIGFDQGPLPELINGKCGILVQEPSELTNAITKLLTNKKLAHTLGKNGKRRFDQLYTWEKVGPQFLKVI